MVYLSLGSNLGDKKQFLLNAIDDLQLENCRVLQCSSVYESEPWGFDCKNTFYNQVIAVKTCLLPMQLLRLIHEIEKKHGRHHQNQYTSRTLDIDILLFNNEVINSKELTIPHQHMHLRNFVLYPLCEIAANTIHPVLKKPMHIIKQNCPDMLQVKKLGD